MARYIIKKSHVSIKFIVTLLKWIILVDNADNLKIANMYYVYGLATQL